MDRNQISKAKKMGADVVVMGAGGCGMAASVAAAENGAKVILLDKKNGGGNSAMAWGLLAADSPFQKLMSISCTTDQVYNLAMEMFHYRVNARIWRAFVDKSGDTDEIKKSGFSLLNKPYHKGNLSESVRKVLDN